MTDNKVKSIKLKKIIKIVLCTMIFMTVLCSILSGCSLDKKKKDDGRLSIVTTLFPQYDFARQIAGEKADVKLLLTPGIEAHDYEPTPSDMIEINDADLFIYTGDGMEMWATTILKSIDNEKLNVLDVSAGIEFVKSDEDNHLHDEHGHTQMSEDEYIAHISEEHHEAEFDPHIWTSPVNAEKMLDNILKRIIDIDPENKKYYEKNAMEYRKKLEKIDKDICELVDNSKQDTIYFGGRFALLYFVREYGLNYESAFDSCSSETEPSARLVAHMVDEMKENGAKIVFYEELVSPKTAEAIAEEVGGRAMLLHSCHNISKDEFENGATYVSIMEQNINNLREGLK